MNRSRVTGNLSSHGILFSDITNDRVGIGSTIPTQKLDVTGTVKATTFVGDGSSLTGIDATTIKHTDGNIKAQAIATGVNVTGNLGVSVDLDVTDDLTIGGELNMIGSSDTAKYFDVRTGTSNSLHIRSSSGGAGNLVTMLSIGRAGSSFVGNLTLGDSSDSSSAAGPEFTLNRNSSSPADADYLGQIKFAGRSDTAVQRNYAKITGKILDASNGTEDGILEFSHIKAGSQVITGRFRSDSLQLLNGTNFSVAGTSEFTGDATFNGGPGAVTLGAGDDIRLTNGNWTGDHTAKIQHHNNTLYLQGGSGANNNKAILLRGSTVDRFYVGADGHFYPNVDSTYDIGSSSIRIRNGYFDTLYGNGANITNVNATTLDSIDSGSFLRSDADDTMSEKLTFTQNGEIEFLKTPGNVTMHSVSSGDAKLILRNLAELRFQDGSDWNFDEWAGIKFSTSTDTMYIGGAASSNFTNNGNAANIDVNFVGLNGSGLKKDGNTVWHAGNDGSGSGLDADTVDGIQGASFLRSDTNDSASGVMTFTNNLVIDHNTNKMLEIKPTNGGPWAISITRDDLGESKVFTHNAGGSYGWVFEHTPYALTGSTYNKIWHAGNDGSGSGLDADTVDGLQVGSTANTGANQLVRTQGSGYINAGYINTVANDTGSGADCVRFYASEDAYIRYLDKSSMRSVMNVSARSTAYGGRESSTTDQNYWMGSMGWGADNFDTTVWDYGSGFIDVWSNPSGQPSGTSHWQAIQSMHYTNGSSRYGFRIACGAGQPSLAYIQGRWNTTTYGWHKLWNAANDGSGSGLDADTVDGLSASQFIRSDTSDTITQGSTWVLNHDLADWAFRFSNGNGTNAHVYMCHGTHGMHIRNDSSGTSQYLLDVYSNSGNRLQVRGGDAQVSCGGDFVANGGAGAITIGAGSDIRFTTGNWTGDHYGKIQLHSNHLYIMGGNSSNHSWIFRFNANDRIYIKSDGTIWPTSNDSSDLGTSANRWRNIYTTDLQLSNESKKDIGGNDVDGTWGDWTLQEGEDKIFMINNRTGKKYSLIMKEEN